MPARLNSAVDLSLPGRLSKLLETSLPDDTAAGYTCLWRYPTAQGLSNPYSGWPVCRQHVTDGGVHVGELPSGGSGLTGQLMGINHV